MVDLVSFVQVNVSAKETDVYLRNKNIYNWRKKNANGNYNKQRTPFEIIKSKNRLKWSVICFGKINGNGSKKNFYPE